MADKTKKRPRDPNQLAKAIVDIATGNAQLSVDFPPSAGTQFARLGGLKGGPARAKKLTASQRKEIARKRPPHHGGAGMTAEVAVLNKTGVAIAADSAVTTGFPSREKIFTTANKIFTLSKFDPVGVMLNGHVEHFGCPWEVLIKDFRSRLGTKKFSTLREYVDLFVAYFTDPKCLKDDGQSVSVLVSALSAVGELESRLHADRLPWRASDIKIALESMLIDEELRYSIPGFESVTERQFNGAYGGIVDQIATEDGYADRPLPGTCKSLFRRVVLSSMTHQMPTQFSTGLVFTGFGREDLYPKLYEISVDGGFLGRVRHYDVQSHDVETDGATITPFAQDDIVNSFLNGIDRKFELFNTSFLSHTIELVVEEALKEHSQLTADERKVALGIVSNRIEESVRDIQSETNEFAETEFRRPVMDVLRTAPKEMLAELAESLVSITSLRQRVSGELETVSGPVDVALLSKGEGFIWIKRKHYFDTELNPHYTTNYFREG